MKRIWLSLLIAVSLLPAVAALQTIQPTPPPTVTAEREPWFLNGSPITSEGGIYLPSGARIHFNPSEMVRSGSFRGIPLYALTTIEPYSMIYVPLSGGLMQPYERRRIGELTGTVGSLTPAYPVGPSAGPGSGAAYGTAPQAAGPPMTIPFAVQTEVPAAAAAPETVSAPAASATPGATVQTLSGPPVGTSGRQVPAPARSQGTNGMFVEYDNARWFSHGTATLLDTSRFVRIGEYHGAPVYREANGSPRVIYIPLNRNAQSLVAPFEKKR